MRKKNVTVKKEPGIKFWRDWLEADLLKREEMVEKLPIMKSIWNLDKLPEKIRISAFTTILNGFFEDLEAQMHLNEDKEYLYAGRLKRPSMHKRNHKAKLKNNHYFSKKTR